MLLPQAIIYVVDCTDKVRMCVAKDEMETLLSHDDLVNEDVPVLFFANKVGGASCSVISFWIHSHLNLLPDTNLLSSQMDLPSALTPVDCMQIMELDRISDKPWHITASNALTGQGVEDGITWLAEHVRAPRK